MGITGGSEEEEVLEIKEERVEKEGKVEDDDKEEE